MSSLKLTRGALRAPVKTPTVFAWGNSVGRAFVRNISHTGMLISQVQDMQVGDELAFIIKLSMFPSFQMLSAKDLAKINSAFELEAQIVRLRGMVVRVNCTEGLQEVGIHFADREEELKNLIVSYVDHYGQNLIFILNLFEQIGQNQECINIIRNLCDLLGYNSQERIALLRQKILHDYQSLEAL